MEALSVITLPLTMPSPLLTAFTPTDAGDFPIERLSEDALLLHVGHGINADTNARVHRLMAGLLAAQLPDVVELAPAYASLLVRLTPDRAFASDSFESWLEGLRILLRQIDHAKVDRFEYPSLRVPVCYGGEYGPDLEAVAAQAKLSTAEVIARHVAGDYRVAMLGFAPGFTYLLGLDPQLHVPRRADPRTRVPAGSVAIGGAQTGIYPSELPGGRNLIGRTPLRLFDPSRDPPCLAIAGQRLQFEAIDAARFAALEAAAI